MLMTLCDLCVCVCARVGDAGCASIVNVSMHVLCAFTKAPTMVYTTLLLQ